MKRYLFLILTAICISGVSAQEAPLKWLKDTPEKPQGFSWGVPWKKGHVTRDQTFLLSTSSGSRIPVQTWPLAFWPDGSVKWSAMAVSMTEAEKGPFTIVKTAASAVEKGIEINRTDDNLRINTGVLDISIPLTGTVMIDEMLLNGTATAGKVQLFCTLENRSRTEGSDIIRYQHFTGNTTRVSLEQSGPVIAVVKIEGKHIQVNGSREWLPFSVYLYLYAGQPEVKMVHSIVFDGDEKKDFISGLGVTFNVPFREEVQNRHVAFSGEKGGVWHEPIQPLVGRRMLMHSGMRNPYQVQMEGKRVPDQSTFTIPNQQLLTDFAVWDAFKLSQVSPNGFTIVKRTGTEASWLQASAGHRAEGLVYAGDVSGGLAVSLKNFWQSYPSSLEINNARSPEATLKVSMWSAEGPPMDLRHYDTIAHGLNSTYEDVQEGLSTPYGIARTSELTLMPVDSVPSNEKLAMMSQEGAFPPRLVCTPEYYHQAGAFGTLWSLPDRSAPAREWMENQLDSSILYYRKMIDQHSWYGFWNYGDIMHSQDPQRHVWRYDIGGMAWDNSELAPDMWLWYSFLRTGDAETFRMAEAMTRHTGEVDSYHAGPLKGLGSRHNVSHWGCGAKESRIAQAAFRRFYYYITADNRTGDVMREMIDAEKSIVTLDPMRLALPFEQAPVKAPARLRFGPDWISLVSNWMTEWERTGDTKWRDKIVAGMDGFSRMPAGMFSGKGVFGLDPETGVITLEKDQSREVHTSHLATIMGGAEMMFELFTFLDHRKFRQSWLEYCEYYSMPRNDPGRSPKKANIPTNSFLVPRLTAYAAMVKEDLSLAERAWSEFRGRTGNYRSMYSTVMISPPVVLNEIDENPRISTNSVAQWGLNAIFLPGMIGDFLR